MALYNELGIRGICHIAIACVDMNSSIAFYEKVLGAELMRDDEFGEYKYEPPFPVHCFLNIGGARIDLQQLGRPFELPTGVHNAFAAGPNDLTAITKRLAEHNVPFHGPVIHGPAHRRFNGAVSVYANDPDGNIIEFCCWDSYPGWNDLPVFQPAMLHQLGFDWDMESGIARPRSAEALVH